MEWFGWGRTTQHRDRLSYELGMGVDQVVQAQNLYALAEAEVQLVSPGLSGDMGAESGGRCGKDKSLETDRKVQEEGHDSEEVWAVVMPVTVTLLGMEAG